MEPNPFHIGSQPVPRPTGSSQATDTRGFSDVNQSSPRVPSNLGNLGVPETPLSYNRYSSASGGFRESSMNEPNSRMSAFYRPRAYPISNMVNPGMSNVPMRSHDSVIDNLPHGRQHLTRESGHLPSHLDLPPNNSPSIPHPNQYLGRQVVPNDVSLPPMDYDAFAHRAPYPGSASIPRHSLYSSLNQGGFLSPTNKNMRIRSIVNSGDISHDLSESRVHPSRVVDQSEDSNYGVFESMLQRTSARDDQERPKQLNSISSQLGHGTLDPLEHHRRIISKLNEGGYGTMVQTSSSNRSHGHPLTSQPSREIYSRGGTTNEDVFSHFPPIKYDRELGIQSLSRISPAMNEPKMLRSIPNTPQKR
eukprot:TRINITY_DN6632_c0_g1_i1.p1 TRINITY_DN6632_c0_g1~~TRINITY_DN6632_c0_g1_i1.p1  ORF type:complete len:362 (-),score=56.06 TRINITY_DN6632_c0_g1_i1:998-2083(-)